MKFFSPNIGRTGRLIRAGMAVVYAIAGLLFLKSQLWAAVLLFVAAIFTAFEALRGWCVVRACGVKTKY